MESPQIWGACFCGFLRQEAAFPRPSKNLLFFAARCLCSAFLVRSLGDFQGRTLEVQPTAFAAGSRANQTAAGRHTQRSAPQNEAAVLCGFTKGRALCWLFPPFLSTQKWGRRRPSSLTLREIYPRSTSSAGQRKQRKKEAPVGLFFSERTYREWPPRPYPCHPC